MAQYVRHMKAILTTDWSHVQINDSTNERAAEIALWLKDPSNVGRYTFWSEHAGMAVWLDEAPLQRFTYAFDTPETAFAFKMRWV